MVISNYLGVFDLYEQLGLEKPEFIRKGLEKMFEVYVRLATPNGGTPCLNDGGNMDVARWCRTASRLYPDRADFRWFATGGKEGSKPDYLSTVFPWAGAVVFRTSWEQDARWCSARPGRKTPCGATWTGHRSGAATSTRTSSTS